MKVVMSLTWNPTTGTEEDIRALNAGWGNMKKDPPAERVILSAQK
jgi:hypothetical protein